MKVAAAFLLVSLGACAVAQPTVEWTQTLPSRGEAFSVTQTDDGGYFVGGDGFSPDRAVVFRTNSQGDTLWSRVFVSPTSGWARVRRVVQDADGGFVLAGAWYAGGVQAYVKKFDADGTALWQNSISAGSIGPIERGFNDLRLLPDGGYIAVGTYSNDIMAARFNASGDTLWTRIVETFGTYMRGKAVEVSGDSCYYVIGNSWNPDHAYFAKVRSTGVVAWTATCGLGGTSVAICQDILNPSMIRGFGTASQGDYSGQPQRTSVLIQNGSGCSQGILTAPPICRIITAVPTPEIAGGFLLGGWAGNSAFNHSAFLLKANASLSVEWSSLFDFDPAFPLSHVNGLCTTADSSFVAVGRTCRSASAMWLLRKYCPAGANAGHVSILAYRPPNWGFRLHHDNGEISRLCFTQLPIGTTGAVSGPASALWNPLPGGDGNDGDSIIFEATSPLAAGCMDTFWLCMPGLVGEIRWNAGCPSDTIGLPYIGVVNLLAETPDLGAYSLSNVAGQLWQVAFTGIPSGAIGSVTGNAAATWSPLPNGDGNNGDSVIFIAAQPLATGQIDTFWVSRPESRCSILWSVGFGAGTLSLWNGMTIIQEFSGGQWDYVNLDLRTSIESNLGRYEVWGRTQHGAFSLLATAAAENDSGPNEYSFAGLPVRYQYRLKVIDSGGCIREFPDLDLTQGINLRTDNATAPLPMVVDLLACPNPFNAMTELRLSIPRLITTSIAVYEVSGRLVVTLHEGMLAPGEHRILFDGSSLPSGLYFARLQSGNTQTTHKLLLLK